MAAKGAIESASAASLEFWLRLASEFWRDVKGLVRIQRFDRDEPTAEQMDRFLNS